MDYVSLKIHMVYKIKGYRSLTKYLADLRYSKCFSKLCMQLASPSPAAEVV